MDPSNTDTIFSILALLSVACYYSKLFVTKLNLLLDFWMAAQDDDKTAKITRRENDHSPISVSPSIAQKFFPLREINPFHGFVVKSNSM